MEEFIVNGTKTGKQEITFEERDSFMYFNTRKFWHCYFDTKTNRLYNQFCVKLMDDAYDYLLKIGAIDKEKNQIFSFEK